MNSYNTKIKQQIKQFENVNEKRNTADLQELPEIFHYWSNKYILPRIIDIFEVNSVTEIFSKYFSECIHNITDCNTLLSVGCGDCSFEIEIVRSLIDTGLNDFTIECLDISPILLEKAKKQIKSLGLLDYFVFIESDINNWQSNKLYCGIMAIQSLHHVQDLEHLLFEIKKSLHPKGKFISSDIIGRNGHMRWPEAMEIVDGIWAFLPDHLKENRPMNTFEERFNNYDCSKEGFEGIRAQDILPLLVERFHFDRFLAYGNLPEVFVERRFGHNYAPDDSKETAFVDFLELLNNLLIDLGHLKPTMMFAVMDKKYGKTKCFKHWTPEFCLKIPTKKATKPRVTKSSFWSTLKRYFIL